MAENKGPAGFAIGPTDTQTAVANIHFATAMPHAVTRNVITYVVDVAEVDAF